MKPNVKQKVHLFLSQFEDEDLEIDADDGLIHEFDHDELPSDIPLLDLDIPILSEDADIGRENKSGLLVYTAHSVKDGLCTCKKENCPVPGNHPYSKNWSDRLERCTTEFISKCKDSRCNIALATGTVNSIIALEMQSADCRKYLEFLSDAGGIRLPESFRVTRKNRTIMLFAYDEAVNSVSNLWGLEGTNLNADGSYIVLHPNEVERLQMEKLADGSVLRDLAVLWNDTSEKMRTKYPLPDDFSVATSVDFMAEFLFPTPVDDEVMPGLSVGEVGILAGAPGVGKTWLSMSVAIWLSLGLPLFNGLLPACGRPKRVMFITCEEGKERIKKRMAKLLRSAGYTPEQLALIRQNVLIEVVKGTDLNTGLIDPNGIKNTRMLTWLISRAQCIDLLILDPLARLIKSDENDATSATMAIEVLENIARTAGCGLLITHHVSKDGTRFRDKSDAYSLRGSSAWTGAVRWQMNVWKMSDVEKGEHGLTDHKAIAVSVSKANNAPTTESIACYRYDSEKILSFVGLLSTGAISSASSLSSGHAGTKGKTEHPGLRPLKDRKRRDGYEID